MLDSQHNDNTQTTTDLLNEAITCDTISPNLNDTQNDNDSESYDEIDEDDVWPGIVDIDTKIHEHEIPQKHFSFGEDDVELPDEITFAPGEGQKPISVFQDENAEYLTFPTIYYGQCRPDNKDRHIHVDYSFIYKYELISADRKVATNIPNLFFKLNKLQMKQLFSKATLAVYHFKTNGRQESPWA